MYGARPNLTPNVPAETRPGWYLKNLLEVSIENSVAGASMWAPASEGTCVRPQSCCQGIPVKST